MDKILNLLVIEDSEADFLLIERHLRQSGLRARCRRAASIDELSISMNAESWDAILSDYSIPQLDFLESFAFIQAHLPDVPVILVSGSIGEEKAVELLKLGICDFVLKDSLVRLAPAIRRGMEETAERRARRAAEGALRQSEEHYRSLFENMLNGFAFCKMIFEQGQPTDFCYIEVNTAFESLTGLRDVVGKKVSEIIPGIQETDPELFEIYGRVALTGAPARFETYVAALAMWFSISVYSPRKEYFVAVFDVITERKRAEEELRASVERLRMALHAADMDAFEYSPSTGKIRRTGSRTQNWGLPVEGRGSDYIAMIHPDDREPVVVELKGLNPAQPAFRTEYRLRGPDGGYRWIAVWAEARFDSEGQVRHVSGVGADVTERKQAEEALRKQLELQDQFAKIAASVPGVVHAFRLRPDGSSCMPFTTPAVEDLFGIAQDVLARDASPFYANVHPDDLQHVRDTVAESARAPSPWHDQYRYLHPVKGLRWIEGWSMPRVEPDGSVLWHGFVMDVTERKQAEEERTRVEAQLRQAQKMEALGTLAGGVAHDFNNILGIILGYTEMVRWDMDEGSLAWKNLQEVLKATERAKELVRQILAFSRRSEQEKRPVQVGLIVKEAMKMLRASLPSTVEIKMDVASNAAVLADPTQIHQVLMNLCTNAAHAMSDNGGAMEVSLTDARLGPESIPSHSGLEPGAYVSLTVKDTGNGIAPAILERIFDPFFTTKGQGVGTGLGLAVVHGIVKSLGGAIEVESLPEVGSTFRVLLPAMESAPAHEAVKSAPLPRGRERILIVDDEPELAMAMKQLLERLGYEVDCRTNGIEALEAFRARWTERPFDLVITDMTMPHLTGVDLAGKLLDLQPNLPIFLCTGFSEKMSAEKARNLGIQGFLMKPVVTGELAGMIRKTLDARMK